MPYLILNSNMNGYQLFSFISTITIGRHQNNDIVLTTDDENTISRKHAEILLDNKDYLLVDRSLNGTRLNGESISEHRLRHGDLVEIADASLTFIDDTCVLSSPEIKLAKKAGHTPRRRYSKTKPMARCANLDHPISDAQLKKKLHDQQIIAEDEKMLALYRDCYAVSRINVPVLILGEPGTGKEKVAQALHHFSKAGGEFVAVNCSAIPDTLFESELFGSTKGAFSHAADSTGKLERADNGTIFLDEIADMSNSSQPKLLRFIEDRSISRLGESRVRELNLRIVSATNRDLKQMIKRDMFRADLFQRLACVRLTIPPLRKRRKDIIPLAEFFLGKYARQYNLNTLEISEQASRIMHNYHWPGNVRELANIMLNACIRTPGGKIMPSHLSSASDEIGEFNIHVDDDFESLRLIEKKHIEKALKQAAYNKTKASKLLDISRDTLYKKMRKHDIG